MTQTDIFNDLKSLPLFGAVSPPLLRQAIESANTHLVKLAAGEVLPPRFSQMLGVVLAGRVQILSADEERAVVLRTAAKGHIFGAASLFLENGAPVSRLAAREECTLLFLARDAVRALLRADPAFMDAYLRFLADRVEFLNSKIRSFTAGSAERRVALWLAERAGHSSVQGGSLSALADTLDIGRASLYRALDKLEAQGLIARNGREIAVPDANALLEKYHS